MAKAKPGKCATPYCKKPKARKGTKCEACVKREYRKRNAMKAAYQLLRSNAKKRGKEFTITFEDFQQFCFETNYIAGKGKTKTSYSIDRIDNDKGYVPGNLRMMTLSDNARKGAKILSYDYRDQSATVVYCPPAEPDTDLPF